MPVVMRRGCILWPCWCHRMLGCVVVVARTGCVHVVFVVGWVVWPRWHCWPRGCSQCIIVTVQGLYGHICAFKKKKNLSIENTIKTTQYTCRRKKENNRKRMKEE